MNGTCKRENKNRGGMRRLRVDTMGAVILVFRIGSTCAFMEMHGIASSRYSARRVWRRGRRK